MTTSLTQSVPARPLRLVDRPIDVKVLVSALWATTMFLFAFVDIFGFWRAEFINGALTGRVPGTDFVVDQAFMLSATLYVVPSSLMVVLSLVLRRGVNRVVNLALCAVYAASFAWSVTGETWLYFWLGHAIEFVLLVVIAVVVWRWPAAAATDVDA